MKSKHDVRAQQSRRRFLVDTALGAAGLAWGPQVWSLHRLGQSGRR